jgi:hypothetical protein
MSMGQNDAAKSIAGASFAAGGKSAQPPKIGLGARVAAWLRDHYPRNARKLIAAEFRVCETVAKGWLRGSAPTSARLEDMAARWGGAFIAHAFADACAAAARKAHDMHESLNRRRDALRAQLKRQTDDLDTATTASRGGVVANIHARAGSIHLLDLSAEFMAAGAIDSGAAPQLPAAE